MADENGTNDSGILADIQQLVNNKKEGLNQGVALEEKQMQEVLKTFKEMESVSKSMLDIQKEKGGLQKHYTKIEKKVLKSSKDIKELNEAIAKAEKQTILARGQGEEKQKKYVQTLRNLKATRKQMAEAQKSNLQKLIILQKEHTGEIKKQNKEVKDLIKEKKDGEKKKSKIMQKTKDIAAGIDSIAGSSLTQFLSISGILKTIFGFLDSSVKMSAKLKQITAVTAHDMTSNQSGFLGQDAALMDIALTKDMTVMAGKWGTSLEEIEKTYISLGSFSKKMTKGDFAKQVELVEAQSFAYATTNSEILKYRKMLAKTGQTQKQGNKVIATSLDHFKHLSDNFKIATHRSKDYLDVVMSITEAMKDYGLSAKVAQTMTTKFIKIYAKAGYTMDQSMARAKKAMTHFTGGGSEQQWAKYMEGNKMVKEIGGTREIIKLKRSGRTEEAVNLTKERIRKQYYGKAELDDTMRANIQKQASVFVATAGMGAHSRALAQSDVAKGSRANIMMKTDTFEMLRKAGGAEALSTLKATVGGDFTYDDLALLVQKLQASGSTRDTFVKEIEAVRKKKEEEKLTDANAPGNPLTNDNFNNWGKKNLQDLKTATKGIRALITKKIYELLAKVSSFTASAESFFDFGKKYWKWILAAIVALKVMGGIGGVGGAVGGAIGLAGKGLATLGGITGAVGGAIGLAAATASLYSGYKLGQWIVNETGVDKALSSLAHSILGTSEYLGKYSKEGWKKYVADATKEQHNVIGTVGSEKRKDARHKQQQLTALVKANLKNKGLKVTNDNVAAEMLKIAQGILKNHSLTLQLAAANVTKRDVADTKIKDLGSFDYDGVKMASGKKGAKGFVKNYSAKKTTAEKFAMLKNLSTEEKENFSGRKSGILKGTFKDAMDIASITGESKEGMAKMINEMFLKALPNAARNQGGARNITSNINNKPIPKSSKKEIKTYSFNAGGKITETTVTESMGFTETILAVINNAGLAVINQGKDAPA